MLDFLPPRLLNAVRHVNLSRLYELRIRAEKPLLADLGEGFVFLGAQGITSKAGALIPTAKEVEEVLFSACEYSVYAVEEQLKAGFLTAKGGERIGIAGTAVTERGIVRSVRDITSLCIRVPHEIFGCADEIYARCFREGLCSVLVMAPPGEGKTTVLRELTRLISARKRLNILVGDERGELSAGDLGETSDVMKFADKLTAFTAGIRAMRPDVIVTDELIDEDYRAVERAICAGIVVLASAHLVKFGDIPRKIFDRYVFLDGRGKVGKILGADGNVA